MNSFIIWAFIILLLLKGEMNTERKEDGEKRNWDRLVYKKGQGTREKQGKIKVEVVLYFIG